MDNLLKKSKVAIDHCPDDLGTPASYTRAQLDKVKAMVKNVAEGSMGGFENIVGRGDTVLLKINTVTPNPPELGFTTDPRILQAVIELIQERNPKKVLIGERSALGNDTLNAFEVCGITAVAKKTGAELCPYDNEPFDMYKIDRPISFNEFPVPRPVRDCDVYIGLPKMKVHVHTCVTCALKLQFGNLPNYYWMSRCHSDDIYQKICNLTRAANPKWFLVDCLYTCQGNGPFSAYPEDLIKDFNVVYGGSDPVAVDTVCEALMDWDNPGRNAPACSLAAFEGLGTNDWNNIEVVGKSIDSVKRRFKRPETYLQGPFPNVNVIMGSACEPGCRVLVRMALDSCLVNGALAALKRPLTIFVGKQFGPVPTNIEGDVIVYGDCAKNILDYYPNAKFYGSTEEYGNCAPLWSNLPGIGLVSYISGLAGI